MSAPDLVHEPRLSGKRVLIVLEGLELAGAERQALLLARHLQRREAAAVEVWTFSKPGSGARLCER
jgi:thymidylate kinase